MSARERPPVLPMALDILVGVAVFVGVTGAGRRWLEPLVGWGEGVWFGCGVLALMLALFPGLRLQARRQGHTLRFGRFLVGALVGAVVGAAGFALLGG